MHVKTFVALLAMAAFSGCAGAEARRRAAADHPASPSAPEAPQSAGRGTLAPDEFDRPKTGMGGAPRATPAPGSPNKPAARYACPMHPDVIQAMPGTCPKCGMRLVPKEDGE